MHTIDLLRSFISAFVAVTLLHSISNQDSFGQANELATDAKPWPQISGDGISASVSGKTIWLQLDANAANSKRAVISRLCAPIRAMHWKGHPDMELKFVPEPQHWVFSWSTAPSDAPVIEIIFDLPPVLPADCPQAIPAGDGSVMLHAYQASTFGVKLRFEPQWYKNTVGYWAVATDYATWDLTIDQPGAYSIAVLQGCGDGQGGSDAVLTLKQGVQVKAELPFQTIDTGHFQNFRWNHLGMVVVPDAGEHTLQITPRRIAKVALFDVRAIHLVRQAKSSE